MDRTSPPVSLKLWLEQVDRDPNIPPEFKNGAQDQLKLSSTSFSSGSELTSSESLHLRVIWHKYLFIEDLKNLMVDDSETGYTGYVSAENMAEATEIFNAKRSLWKSYFKEVGLREEPLGDTAVPLQPLGPSRQCGTFFLVLYWQLLSMTTDVDETPTTNDLRRTSSISKPGPGSKIGPAATSTNSAVNQPATPYKSVTDRRMEQDTPTSGIYRTPQATSYVPAPGGKLHKPAADETFVNMALLELLHGIKLDVGVEFSNLDWLATRLPLKLVDRIKTTNSKTGDYEDGLRELMTACLDGYLCRRARDSDKNLNTVPLAILETKPYTRSSDLASIRRQEGAQMAFWISQAEDKKTGLLKTSTCGRKRRLMVSQDRHEIYITVGEYGPGFEKHIRPSFSIAGGSVRSEGRIGKPGSSSGTSTQVNNLPANSGSITDRRDPSLLAGSPSYIRRVEKESIGVADNPRSTKAQRTRAAPRARKSSRKHERWVPEAGDFLVMHEFGPFDITDPIHMEVLIRRLIGFMLELRGPLDGVNPNPSAPERLIQPSQIPTAHGGLSSTSRRTLQKARSWPGQIEKPVEDWVVISSKAEWGG